MGLAINKIWKKSELNSMMEPRRFATKKCIHPFANRTMEQAVELAMQDVAKLKPVMVKWENPQTKVTELTDMGLKWSSVWVRMEHDRWYEEHAWFLTTGMGRQPQELSCHSRSKMVVPLLFIDREYRVELGLFPYMVHYTTKGVASYHKLRSAFDELLMHALQRAEFHTAFRHSA